MPPNPDRDAIDSLDICVLAAERAMSDDMNRDVALQAVTAAAASLETAWTTSQSASALLAVSELVTPHRDIVSAALACTRLAREASMTVDADVDYAIDVLDAWLATRCSDDERLTASVVLRQRLDVRRSYPPSTAWFAYCAVCVGISTNATP